MKPSTPVRQVIVSSLQASVSLKQALLENQKLIQTIADVAEGMSRALADGHKLFFFGNGGSAADAQHLAAELVGRYQHERRALPAIALTANTSTLTAIGNDYSYERVFARQLEALCSPGDVAVGISTSGKSPNVLSAMRSAKEISLTTVGMTGMRGGELAALSDYCICVPSEQTPRIQEAHILIGHILCEIIEQKFVSEHDVS
jgi:D-sedoheptulose 7-phosphate isomerase